MKRKRMAQPRIKGIIRIPSSESLHPETERKLQDICNRYGCTMSYAKNTILNDALKVRAPKYYMTVVKTNVRRRA